MLSYSSVENEASWANFGVSKCFSIVHFAGDQLLRCWRTRKDGWRFLGGAHLSWSGQLLSSSWLLPPENREIFYWFSFVQLLPVHHQFVWVWFGLLELLEKGRKLDEYQGWADFFQRSANALFWTQKGQDLSKVCLLRIWKLSAWNWWPCCRNERCAKFLTASNFLLTF